MVFFTQKSKFSKFHFYKIYYENESKKIIIPCADFKPNVTKCRVTL
jgi:hypothetical protein